jgi:hypothetical protein
MVRLFSAGALLLATLGVVAVGSPGVAMTEPSPAPVQCEIRSQVVPGGLRLSAMAVARAPTHGSYELVVTKRDGAGSSRTAQSGAFHLESGQRGTLGEVTLSLGPSGAIEVELNLRYAGGEISCRRNRPREL